MTDTPQVTVEKKLTHDQLWSALRDIEDLLDRCMLPGFVMGETARCVVNDIPLEGEGVEIGLRKAEWSDQVKGMFKTLRPQMAVGEAGAFYLVGEVPVVVRIIASDYEFLKNMNKHAYQAGDYLVPNPFELYFESRFSIE